MRKRDSKTGRFLKAEVVAKEVIATKAVTKKEKVAAKPASVKASGSATCNLKIGVKTTRVLETPLEVYGKKSIESGDSSKMRIGSEVVLEMLETLSTEGTNLVRVCKTGSTRTFYTTSDRIV